MSNNVKKSLFFVKASIPLVLTLSFVILPIARSEGEEILRGKNIQPNSQTVRLLKSDMSSVLGGGTGGAEILTNGNALIASISAASSNSSISNKSSDEISVYKVREGDTLSEIAEMFDVKVSTIRGFNNIRTDNDLKVGQELLILPVDGVSYKVEKGDTLSSVAKKFKSDEMDIALFNDLPASGELKIGEEIIIPNAEPIIEEIKEEPKKSTSKTASPSNTTKTTTTKSSGATGSSYPAGFYIHPIPRGAVKSQGFHGPYQAQDLAAKEGTPIVASSGGRVIAVRSVTSWNGGYGGTVIIDDGRANVLYAHMSRIDVTQGQTIAQGEVIGAVGNTGRSTGPHLHIEYRGKKGPMKTPVW